MQQFSKALGRFQGQHLQDVGVEKFPSLPHFVGQRSYAGPDGCREHGHVVGLTGAHRPGVIRQAQAFSLGLATEVEPLKHRLPVRGIDQEGLPVRVAGEELENGVGPNVRAGQHNVFHPAHLVPQLQGVRLFLFQRLCKASLVPQVPHVEHLRVDIGENLIQVVIIDDVQPQVRRVGYVNIVPHLGRGDCRGTAGRFRRFPSLGRANQFVGLGFDIRHQLLPFVGVLDRVGQGQAAHGVLRVGHQAVVFRRDAQAGKAIGQRCASHQDWRFHACLSEVPYRLDHHLRRFHQQARQTHDVGTMLLAGVNQVLGRHLYAQVNDLVTVVGKDNVHQVLANVVDVALDGGQDNLALGCRIGPLHVGLQVGHGELHRLSRLQHLGHD